MAAHGVLHILEIVTPVLSVVVSVFMLGLGVGSLLAGRWGLPLATKLGVSPSILYGLAELTIGMGAFAVPALFAVAERTLLATGASGSGQYLLLSALAIVGAILPWCVMMGTTFPLMMAYISLRGAGQNESFSYLYLANVIGAMCGTLASALVLIELFGFATTSLIAAMVNGTIAIISFLLPRAQATMRTYGVDRIDTDKAKTHGGRWRLLVLFTTGFSSLAMEVVWTRAFTIVLHTTIYAFGSGARDLSARYLDRLCGLSIDVAARHNLCKRCDIGVGQHCRLITGDAE